MRRQSSAGTLASLMLTCVFGATLLLSLVVGAGVYPATYKELKEKSGLAIDDEKYIVVYEIFGSNIRPSVTVMERRVE